MDASHNSTANVIITFDDFTAKIFEWPCCVGCAIQLPLVLVLFLAFHPAAFMTHLTVGFDQLPANSEQF